MYLNLVHRLARRIHSKEARPDIAAVPSHGSIHNWFRLRVITILLRTTIYTPTHHQIGFKSSLQTTQAMDIKTPVAGSSKSVENTTENNTKNNINTMTERELNNMLSKGVDPKKETKETLSQLVRWRIQEYEQHNWRRYLSEIFAEEFVQFVKEDFDTLDKQILDSLRDCLRVNGVYVPKGRGIAASQALADVVQEDIPWPEDNLTTDSPPPTVPLSL